MPGVPKGTPAVTTTWSPSWARPSSRAMAQALLTISVNEATSEVWTQCAPQMTARRRAVSTFEDAGFHTIAHRIVSHQNSADWVSFAEKLSLRSDSFLARIPDDEFDAGIAALRRFVRNAKPGRPVIEDVDFFVFQR